MVSSTKAFLYVTAVFCLAFQDVPKLKKTKLTDRISVSLPEDFHAMTDDEIAAKYFVARKPAASYASPDRIADFTLNVTNTPARPQDLAMLKNFLKSGIQGSYTKVEYLQDGVVKIGERDFVALEFTAEIRDDDPNSANRGVTRQYSYLLYTPIQGKLNVLAFNCPAQVRQRWQPVAKAVMETVRVSRAEK